MFNPPVPPSDAQMIIIGYIEENLGITYTGESKADAQEFISEHIEASKVARQRIFTESLQQAPRHSYVESRKSRKTTTNYRDDPDERYLREKFENSLPHTIGFPVYNEHEFEEWKDWYRLKP